MEVSIDGAVNAEKELTVKQTEVKDSTAIKQPMANIENTNNRKTIVIACVVMLIIVGVVLMCVFIPKYLENQEQFNTIETVMQQDNEIGNKIIKLLFKRTEQLDSQNEEPIGMVIENTTDKNLSLISRFDSGTTNINNTVVKDVEDQVLNINKQKMVINTILNNTVVIDGVSRVPNLKEQESLMNTTQPPSTIYQDMLHSTHRLELIKRSYFKSFNDEHSRELRRQRLIRIKENLEKTSKDLSYIILQYEHLTRSGIKYEYYVDDEGKSRILITDSNKLLHKAQKHFDELQNLKEVRYDLIKVLIPIKKRVANLEEWFAPSNIDV